MTAVAVNQAFMAAFIFLVVHAVVSDVTSLSIPNWISASLVATFIVYAAVAAQHISPVRHLLFASAVFAAGFVMFLRGWMGGGDVKFAAAVALWAGPEMGLQFLACMGLAGLALGCVIMMGAFYLDWDGSGSARSITSRFFPRWVRRGLTPYGFAIGAGALATVPALIV